MEAMGCLVPEFRSEKCCGHGTQLFEKMQCFYVATYLRILSCYVKLLVKRQLESRQRHLEKTVVVKAGDYVVFIGRKTIIYRLEAGESRFLETRTVMSIAMCSRISLTCL